MGTVIANANTRNCDLQAPIASSSQGNIVALTFMVANFQPTGNPDEVNNFPSSKSAGFVWPIFRGLEDR
jgi:hypothetical protein